MLRRTALLAIVVVRTLATSATSAIAELALTKPSALVTLYTSGPTCSVNGRVGLGTAGGFLHGYFTKDK